MLKAIGEFILVTICFLVWGFIWFVIVPVAFAEATDIPANNDDTERGSYYKNWRTEGGTLPGPIATLPPLEPIPTVDPSQQEDEGGSGSSGVSNNRGVSFIGQMCSANAKEQKKFWNETYKNATTWNAGWLYGQTFKQTGCQWSKAFMKMPHAKRVRVHICNCTCFKDRNRTCGSNECFPGVVTTAKANQMVANHNAKLFKTIDKIIENAIADAKEAGNTLIDYAVSPCLESGLTAANRKIMMNYVVSKFASLETYRANHNLNPIKYVDNPLNDTCLKNRFCEKHGYVKRGGKGIADNDGISYDNVAQATYGGINSGAWMVLAWRDCLNGLPPKATFIDPITRTTWCSKSRDAANFAHFTEDNFNPNPSSTTYSSADTKGCTSYRQIDEKFAWKLGEGRNFTTWVTPPNTPRFEQVWLMKNGKKIDYAGGGIHRMGTPYHDASRLVYDFQQPLQNYPDTVVLHGKVKGSSGEICWKFPKPSYRPFNNPNAVHQN